jgi:GT2 family glycosyltransferase
MTASPIPELRPRPDPDRPAAGAPAGAPAPAAGVRPRTRGRFLEADGAKLYLRGVTYGPFGAKPNEYLDRQATARDFALMAAHGINAIRTYTPPERWLLDLAQEHGLWVLPGLCAELRVDGAADGDDAHLDAHVRALAGHPAILAWVIANEIPAPIVRWVGRTAAEAWLRRVCDRVRALDPGALVTYANYPTTEYLELPYLDLLCFNVYLEDHAALAAYLPRLHNLATERPLLMGELGLDSRRHGAARQAQVLGEQIRIAFASGCAGTFAYAWSDQWHRGGEDIAEWAFGLTTRDRVAKPALAEVARAYAEAPLAPARRWPRISVVVCTFNGSRTLRDCLEGCTAIDYPDYEVIVVDDGSTDHTAQIAAEFDVRLIRTANRGLSNARNTGIAAAQGEIVAFTDDDARPEPHWLQYLAEGFEHSPHAGIGGPNIPPPGDGLVANCVSASPGGPAVVLVTDTEAEHIPGCNMAFRKSALEAISGFDAQFRTAGDDVDLCWRLLDAGFTLGYHAGAVVWHHSRGSVRTFWKQQRGYGRAESLLERKWPDRFNGAGQARWAGRVYGGVALQRRASHAAFIYGGAWGSAPYQFLYEPEMGRLTALTLSPEWYLVTAGLVLTSLLGILWAPLLLAIPVALVSLGIPLVRAVQSAVRARFPDAGGPWHERLAKRALTTWLHLMQPAARLRGRFVFGLTLWRMHGDRRFVLPWPRQVRLWEERWVSGADRLTALVGELRKSGVRVRNGGDYDRWDVEAWGGPLGAARLRMAAEDHAHGCQLVRVAIRPRVPRGLLLFAAALAALGITAAAAGAWLVSAVYLASCAGLAAMVLRHAGAAMAALVNAAGARGER